MVNKIIKYKKLLLILIVSLLSFLTFAQENDADDAKSVATEGKSTFIGIGNDGNEYVGQELFWPHIDYVSKYEIEIQQKKNNATDESDESYDFFGKYETTVNKFQLSLHPGSYRYAISIFDMSETFIYRTKWMTLNVKKANKPQITNVYPKNIYLDDIYDGNFNIDAINILPESIFYLQNKITRTKVEPLSKDINYERGNAKLTFPINSFDTGLWQIRIVNPGNFDSRYPVNIRFKKPIDFDIQAGWLPTFFIGDKSRDTEIGRIPFYFDTQFMLLGASAKMTLIGFKKQYFQIGGEIAIDYHWMTRETEGYSIQSGFMNVYGNLVYRIPIIKNILSLDLHGGAGVLIVQSLQFLFSHDMKTEPITSGYISFDGGISLKGILKKRLYIEGGADVSVSLVPDILMTTISFPVSVGWQF